MKLMQCKRCGGELNKEKDGYVCAYCHATYEDDTLERAYAELKNSLENLVGEQIEENAIRERERSLANLRRQLWDKTHEKYVNSKAIVKICREIKKIDSDDFAANFYETMNDESEDYAQVTDFLDEIDVVTQADYVDDVVEFVVKSLKIEYLTSLNMLVERAYTSDKVKYGEMISKIEAEAEKVEEGIYSLERPRDVFVAYSSKDVKRVNELVRYLEGQGIECFVAMRNLQQGRKSVENYEKALETAMDNCKVFLLVSSKNSRALSCDTIKRELPYIKRRDLECKPEYRNLGYDKMPEKYRKPRIQYRIDDERTPATDRQIKEFFGTLQWRYDLESVAEQVGTYLTEDVYEEREEPPVPTTDKQDLYEEFKKRMREEEARKAEERRQEELRKAEEQRKEEETRRAEELRKAEEARNAEFEIENGVLKKYTGKGGDVVIPDGITTIGEKAFYFARITSVTIPDSVTVIGKESFSYADITSVTIPNGVTEICEQAFYHCESLTNVEIPKSVMKIGWGAFNGCKNLVKVTIPGVAELGKFAFADCSSLTNVTISEGITSIGDSAFLRCSSLTNIIIPEGVTSIGDGAFSLCSSLPSITMPNSLRSIHRDAFNNCRSLTNVTIPEGVTSIGNSAFSLCGNLKSVTIPNSVTTIGEGAFYMCRGLKSVTIPSSVTTIGKWAFYISGGTYDSGSLKKIYAEATSKPSGWHENWNPDKKTVVWGHKIKQANVNAVKQAPVATKAPESESARLDRLMEARRIINQTVFPIDGDTLTGYKGKSEIVDIPYGITSIGKNAFLFSKTVKTVIIPESVRVIEKDAFNGCKNLTSVTLGKGVERIGNGSFWACKALEKIDMTDTPLKSIDNDAFNRCVGLKEVILPKGLKTINKNAFYGCKGLEKVVIPKSVEVIEDGAFMNCPNLTIYAEASKKPVGWISTFWKNWNFDDRPVEWDYKGK